MMLEPRDLIMQTNVVHLSGLQHTNLSGSDNQNSEKSLEGCLSVDWEISNFGIRASWCLLYPGRSLNCRTSNFSRRIRPVNVVHS